MLILALPTLVAARYDRLLTIPDTVSRRWPGSPTTCPLEAKIATWVATFQLTPTRAAIERQRTLDAASLRGKPTGRYSTSRHQPTRGRPTISCGVNLVRERLPRDWLAYLDEQGTSTWWWVLAVAGRHGLPEFDAPLGARMGLGGAAGGVVRNHSLILTGLLPAVAHAVSLVLTS